MPNFALKFNSFRLHEIQQNDCSGCDTDDAMKFGVFNAISGKFEIMAHRPTYSTLSSTAPCSDVEVMLCFFNLDIP